MPSTVAERNAKLRARRAALGLVRVEFWCHPADRARLMAYAERLRKARDRATAKGVPPAG